MINNNLIFRFRVWKKSMSLWVKFKQLKKQNIDLRASEDYWKFCLLLIKVTKNYRSNQNLMIYDKICNQDQTDQKVSLHENIKLVTTRVEDKFSQVVSFIELNLILT